MFTWGVDKGQQLEFRTVLRHDTGTPSDTHEVCNLVVLHFESTALFAVKLRDVRFLSVPSRT